MANCSVPSCTWKTLTLQSSRIMPLHYWKGLTLMLEGSSVVVVAVVDEGASVGYGVNFGVSRILRLGLQQITDLCPSAWSVSTARSIGAEIRRRRAHRAHIFALQLHRNTWRSVLVVLCDLKIL